MKRIKIISGYGSYATYVCTYVHICYLLFYLFAMYICMYVCVKYFFYKTMSHLMGKSSLASQLNFLCEIAYILSYKNTSSLRLEENCLGSNM